MFGLVCALASANAATVSVGFNDLILGFRATGGAGAADNLEVNLGTVSQFATATGTLPITRLAAAELVGIYGANWNSRLGVDLFWGVVGTVGRTAGGPNGQPVSTLWATAIQDSSGASTPWLRRAGTLQNNGVVAVEAMFTDSPGSLNGAASLASNVFAADIVATAAGSWSAQRGTTNTAFAFFSPSLQFDNPGTGFNFAKADLYEVQPGSGNATRLGTFTLSATGVLSFSVSPSGGGTPSVTTQPVSQAVPVGGSVTFGVVAVGTPTPTYQWKKDGAAISGATNATLTISSVQAPNAGSYSVTITNSAGAVTSNAVTLTVNAPVASGRIINLSVLTDIATVGDSFTVGYVVGGGGTSGAKPLVIRAAGPSLGALGVPGTLDDPKLETFAGSTKTGENDNWGGSAQLTSALAAVGAFPYTGPTSKDAAVAASILTRDNSVAVSGVATGTGKVIAEIYDATPPGSFIGTTPRLLNVSVRKHLGAGVTAGFVLGGASATKVLIRAVGPGLASFGVPDTVVDPQLALFNDKSAKIGENNDWGGTAELLAAFGAVGAFGLPGATSKDAALLVTLQPGLYSVQVSGTANTTGVALVEVYEVP